MKVIQRAQALKKTVLSFKKNKESIGFVPTMGYLHEGHLTLMRRAKKENDRVVASIFVNPLQFGPSEDLRRYPRDLKRDIRMLKAELVDVLYVPNVASFYPKGFQTAVSTTKLSRSLCGASRPTHFAGVTTVLLKLLNQVSPDVLYLGQKDYQQFRVVQQMVRDLEVPVEVRMCPIVREQDGLAMSSRNYNLDAEERMQATYLHRALAAAEGAIRKGIRTAERLKHLMRKELSAAGRARVDYAEIVDAESLLPVVQLKTGQKVELALAVFFSKTRLIDNRIIRV